MQSSNAKNAWGTSVEIERRNRLLVSIHAYAYEIKNDPLISDAEYDALAMTIDLSVDTGNKIMDKWFRDNYSEFTGQWIHKHPDLGRINTLYELLKSKPASGLEFLD